MYGALLWAKYDSTARGLVLVIVTILDDEGAGGAVRLVVVPGEPVPDELVSALHQQGSTEPVFAEQLVVDLSVPHFQTGR